MSALLLVASLELAGLLPAWAGGAEFPQALALAPLIGSLIASFAGLTELLIGGSIFPLFVCWAVMANVAGVMVLVLRDKRRANLRRFGGEEPATPSIWSVATLLLVTICAGVPLLGLRADLIGYDAFSIWTLHAAFFYGGHHLLVSDLKDAAYAFSNPDYPPLIPATGALGYRMAGHVDYRVAVAITAALNAASMGLLGCGVANMWRRLESFEARLVAVVGGSVLCIAGFGIAGQYGVDGYADLLWSAAATTAVVYGLVSPRSTANLFTAVVTATAAALTKNEGLIASVIVLSLVSVRYVQRHQTTKVTTRRLPFLDLGVWATRSAVALLLVLPGALWAIAVKLEGVGSDFFAASSQQSIGLRFTTTIPQLAKYLHILPLALGFLVLGGLVRSTRRRLGVGNPVWLWVALVAWTASLVYTYTVGTLSIGWWLSTSEDRTTIFPQLLLCTELTVWSVLVVEQWRATMKDVADHSMSSGDQSSRPLVLN